MYFCSRYEDEVDAFSLELLKQAYPDIDAGFINLFLKEGWKQ